MSDFEQTCRLALRVFDDLGLSWALVGGFAVSVRTEPRFTRDVDLVVAVPDDERAEEVVRRFVADGHSLLASIEHEGADRLATARVQLAGSAAAETCSARSATSSQATRE